MPADERSPREVAEELRVTPRTVQRWIASGRLPAARVGGRLRVSRSSLQGWRSDAPRIGRPIRSLLVANRGEIAARIARTARGLGIRAVAVHVHGERPFGDFDAAVEIASYLDGGAIIDAARRSSADAIHPGYGFLAESDAFAEAVVSAGLTWVGPPAAAIAAMGDKAAARRRAAAHGVPVLPGYDGDDQRDVRLAAEAERIGWPLLVKPSAGGGGKGLRLVRAAGELGDAVAASRREAMRAFGDERLILERYVERARHVEVQVLFDGAGSGVHLGERDCSAQRRHQKIVEEAPAPAVGPGLREELGRAALAVARAAGYRNAGTVEFALAEDGTFAFLEMNTRLQVEHPVTEAITGRDLVADQLRIAAGEPLELEQGAVRLTGSAIEARLYAEEPEAGFLPAVGTIADLRWPGGEGIRTDAGVAIGDVVSTGYDPLLAKLIGCGTDRAQALARLRDALEETRVLGVRTNLRFLRWLLAQPAFADGDVRTDTVDATWRAAPVPLAEPAWQAAGHALVGARDADDVWRGGWRLNAPPTIRLRAADDERAVGLASAPADGLPASAMLDGAVAVDVEGQSIEFWLAPAPSVDEAVRHASLAEGGSTILSAPMPGRVVALRARVGDDVDVHQPVVVLEAMKMETVVTAAVPGTVDAIHVAEGQQVERGERLAEIAPRGS
jgi:excisionase family DNA binding protein